MDEKQKLNISDNQGPQEVKDETLDQVTGGAMPRGVAGKMFLGENDVKLLNGQSAVGLTTVACK